MTEPALDPYAVAVGLAVLIVGPTLAPYLAAYSLILIGWFGGMLIGVYRRPPASRANTAGFVVVTFIITLLTTVPIAQGLAPYLGGMASTSLLSGVAIIMPAIGHNWADIAKRVWSIVANRFERQGQ